LPSGCQPAASPGGGVSRDADRGILGIGASNRCTKSSGYSSSSPAESSPADNGTGAVLSVSVNDQPLAWISQAGRPLDSLGQFVAVKGLRMQQCGAALGSYRKIVRGCAEFRSLKPDMTMTGIEKSRRMRSRASSPFNPA